jgi:hypothetical protein
MNDLDVLTGRSRGSLMRSARAGVALFGSGFVVGIVAALVFGALIRTVVIVAAIVIVLVAAARMAMGRKRD